MSTPNSKSMMGLSKKEFKILTLLVIDTVFFCLEIIIGYMVNSLALIADSFHMLNDIISLIVALWAVNVAKNRSADGEYTYGWLRAEILGALINAVFLIALCFTILIEAIQRLLDPPKITNAQLILIVGIFGLLSNIVGLFLFHEHGHSHGGLGDESHSHSHGSIDEESLIENPHGHNHEHGHNHSHGNSHGDEHAHDHDHDDEEEEEEEEVHTQRPRARSIYSKHATNENTALLESNINGSSDDLRQVMPSYVVGQLDTTKKTSKGKHSNTHQKSLNMQGVFLHVLGDALGNVGVILTAILIWKTDYSWKYYFDPIISLFITCIIFSSALPLCKRSSRILLQGTPSTVVTSDVIQDVLEIPSVLGVHDFHIWNLTEKMLIASLHVELDCSPDNFLKVASDIKVCLHDYGIHSATIQPEFSEYYSKHQLLPRTYSSSQLNESHDNQSPITTAPSTRTYESSGKGSEIHCLIDASANCTAKDCLQ